MLIDITGMVSKRVILINNHLIYKKNTCISKYFLIKEDKTNLQKLRFLFLYFFKLVIHNPLLPKRKIGRKNK